MIKNLRGLVFSLSLLVILSLPIGCAQKNTRIENGGQELETVTQSIMTPTQISSFTPTSTHTPVPIPEAQDIWQVSPDGHLVYNEAQLYGGMFTIDKEHPEYAEKYWEDTIRGLWNLNFVAENTAFLSQFPTDDSLIDYLQKGGGSVSNLWIPVIYPNKARQYEGAAAMEKIDTLVDLSKIAVGIYKPTLEEIYHYSPNPVTGTKYVHYNFGKGSVFVDKLLFEDSQIIQFIFRQDLLTDDLVFLNYEIGNSDTKPIKIPVLMPQKTPEENLLAATHLIRSWPIIMLAQANPSPYSGWYSWKFGEKPPMMDISSIGPGIEDYKKIISLDQTPLAIR